MILVQIIQGDYKVPAQIRQIDVMSGHDISQGRYCNCIHINKERGLYNHSILLNVDELFIYCHAKF